MIEIQRVSYQSNRSGEAYFPGFPEGEANHDGRPSEPGVTAKRPRGGGAKRTEGTWNTSLGGLEEQLKRKRGYSARKSDNRATEAIQATEGAEAFFGGR